MSDKGLGAGFGIGLCSVLLVFILIIIGMVLGENIMEDQISKCYELDYSIAECDKVYEWPDVHTNKE